MRRGAGLMLAVWVMGLSGWVMAEVKLPAILSDNMVLQAGGKTVPVWGWADTGEAVAVQLGDQSASTKADDKGQWRVNCLLPQGKGPLEMTVRGSNTLTIRNILIGEVWLCSGQSNMQMSVDNSADASQETAAAQYPEIRLFMVARTTALEPQSDCKGKWQVCGPGTVGGFSAAGYFFGRELHQQLNVPVGLIGSYWGGTPAEAWTSLPALQAQESLRSILERFEARMKALPEARAKYEEAMKAWEAKLENPKAPTTRETQRKPQPPQGPDSPYAPARLYNAMIHPLIPYGIRGAIWYQGEANAGQAYQYRTLLPTMIADWRQRWGQGEFPFGIVQLANYMARKSEPGESAWAELREAQSMTAQQANNGLAVIIDIGDAKDIHPKNKQDVGKRLALWALAKVYGKDLVYSGPTYESMSIDGDKIRVKFGSVGGGLVARDADKLSGFAIAGEDHKFTWAEAKIDGDSVVVSSPEVTKPVAVRYGWADNPECNLYNKEGLPASPFRTDQWDGVTAKAR